MCLAQTASRDGSLPPLFPLLMRILYALVGAHVRLSGRGRDGPAAVLRRRGEGRRGDPRPRHGAAAVRTQEEVAPVRCQDISAVGGPQNR